MELLTRVVRCVSLWQLLQFPRPKSTSEWNAVLFSDREDPPSYNAVHFFGSHHRGKPFGKETPPSFDPIPSVAIPSIQTPSGEIDILQPCCCYPWILGKKLKEAVVHYGKLGYTSLLRDDGFSNLSVAKVRRLAGVGLAEMLGVMLFMSTGCGSLVTSITGSQSDHMQTVLSFALGICASIVIFGPISGPMLNPCLNVTWLIMGHMSLIKFVYYTVFQVIGAYLGTAFIVAVTPGLPDDGPGFCTTHPNPDVPMSAAFAVEFFLAFFVSLGLCHLLDKRASDQHSLAFAKFSVIIVAIVIPLAKYEGGSINPARSLGPALLSGDFKDQWLYWTAPNLGAAIGAILYKAFLDAPVFEEEDGQKRRENDA